MMGTPIARFMAIMLIAAGSGGGTWMKDSAILHVEPAGYHAFSTACIIYLLSSLLSSSSRGCSSLSGKRIDSSVSLIMMSSLIGCSFAWQIPPMKVGKNMMAAGPLVAAEGKMSCSHDACQVDISLVGKLQLKEGHVMRFNIKDDETGNTVPGTLAVNSSITSVVYNADVILPYYDLAYFTALDNDKSARFDDWKLPLKDNDDVRQLLQTHLAKPILQADHEGSYYPTAIRERTFGTLADKFKCGHWGTDDLKIKQIYAIQPYKTGGHIQWMSTKETVLNLTMCLELNGEICFDGTFNSDEEIAFTHPDFVIRVSQSTRPSIPFTPPLLSRYVVINDTHLQLTSWKVMHRPLRGDHRYGDIGAVQTTCVWTNTSTCAVGTFPMTEIIDWTLSSSTQCAQPQQGILIALIIALIIAAAIAAAVVGGLAGAAGCKHCGFETVSVTAPDTQNHMTDEFPTINSVFPGLDKELPDKVELAHTDGQSYAPTINLKISNFEGQHIQMSVDGSGLHMELPTDLGEVMSWIIPLCTINLAGGISECEFQAQFNGPDTEVPLYTRIEDTFPVSVSVYLRQGMNTGSIGVQVANDGSRAPEVCLGKRRLAQCATAAKLKYTTNPDSITIDEEVGVTNVQTSSTWSFSNFWDALGSWWAKLIAVVVWVVGIVLLVVMIIVAWKLGKGLGALAMAGRSKASLWHSAGQDIFAEYKLRTDGTVKDINIVASSLPDYTQAEFDKWIMVEDQIWEVLTPKSVNVDTCTTNRGHTMNPVLNQQFPVDYMTILRDRYTKPPCHICEFRTGGDPIYTTGVYLRKYWREGHDGSGRPEKSWQYNTKLSCQDAPAIPVLQYCILQQQAQNYCHKGGSIIGYMTPACRSELVPEDQTDVADKHGDIRPFQDVNNTECDSYGLKSTIYNKDELLPWLHKTWGKLWWTKATLLDHVSTTGILEYRMFIRDNVVIYNKHMADIPIEDKDTYGMLVHSYPLKSCRGCPLILVFKAMNTGGITHPFTNDMWVKLTTALISLTGEYRAVTVETSGDYTMVTFMCKKCEVNLHGKFLTVTGSIPVPEGKCQRGDVMVDALAGGPLTGPCFCLDQASVMCVQADHIARFESACFPHKTYDNSSIYLYTGGYRCGTGGGLAYVGGHVIAMADLMITDDNWASYSITQMGHKINMRGNLIVATDNMEHYSIYKAPERNCTGSEDWTCLYENHKGVIWLSIGIPLGFLFVIIMMLIIRACCRVGCSRRLKRLGTAPVRMADSMMQLARPFDTPKPTGMRLRRT